ncbi:hypothetical protein F8S13_05120 [Chloroflexia bacterium SDU3-3]|nr:hypothetical protein F8S13_05120 [Chloroflexia bacterium SDU3-3]
MSPSSLLILLIATACASVAHLIWGRHWLQLIIYWMAAFAGCLIIYVTGLSLPIRLPHPAGIPLLESIAAAWILLFVASKLRL